MSFYREEKTKSCHKEKRVSPWLFGQNLEHTRGCIYGGLSAELIRNRKFAGKPSRDGIAADWNGVGEDVFFDLLTTGAYCRHAETPMPMKMVRRNEMNCQRVQHFSSGAPAGLRQGVLPLAGGKKYQLKAALKSDSPAGGPVRISLTAGECILFQTEELPVTAEWQVFEFSFFCEEQAESTLWITTMHSGSFTVGMVSLMPADHWLGMRRDVVEHLREIGTTMLRWPGGNFAGEYRWRDGLLPADLRAPLQSFMEMETQPFSHGFDNNELGTDEIVALCREIGAEPYFTINLAWGTPEESAAWVEYCNGSADTPMGRLRAERGHAAPYQVKFWSLGNEMGYGHMEGPNSPDAYRITAGRHAEAMRNVSPDILLCGSAPQPSREWIEKVNAPMAAEVPWISHHAYEKSRMAFSTPEEIRRTYEEALVLLGYFDRRMAELRSLLPDTLKISFDEWNLWYAWYRNPGVLDGIVTGSILHWLLRNAERYGVASACYFQPVNEGAIRVEPYGSRLTATGQLMRIFSRHAGGTIVEELTDETRFATRRADGSLYITICNLSFDRTAEYLLPLAAENAELELLTPDGLRPGSRFRESSGRPGQPAIRLAPLSFAAIRLPPEKKDDITKEAKCRNIKLPEEE